MPDAKELLVSLITSYHYDAARPYFGCEKIELEQLNLILEAVTGDNCHSGTEAAPPSNLDPCRETLPLSQPLLQNYSSYQSQVDVLRQIWVSLVFDSFPDRLDLLEYTIEWSTRRQKRTLASCNLRAKRVLVAQELNHSDYHKFLAPLIYHELCHAVLGFSVRSASGKSRWHGKEFRTLERQHPEISILDMWIKEGGWRQAIRRHRARFSAKKPKVNAVPVRRSLLSFFLKRVKLISVRTKTSKRTLKLK